MDVLKDYGEYIVGIPLGILTLWVTLWIYGKQIQKKKLSYIILANEEILKYSDDIMGKIEVKYEGKIVNKLFITVVRVLNNGNIPIQKSDFEGNLTIDLGVKPIRSEISDKKPQDINVELISITSILELNTGLMNPGDYFSIKILSDREIKKPVVSGRIAGINKIQEFDSNKYENQTQVKIWSILIISVPLGFLIAPIARDYFENFVKYVGEFIFTIVCGFSIAMILLILTGEAGIRVLRSIEVDK